MTRWRGIMADITRVHYCTGLDKKLETMLDAFDAKDASGFANLWPFHIAIAFVRPPRCPDLSVQ